MKQSIPTVDMSPTTLSYAATLRGVKPRKAETPFVYALMECQDALTLICLAASNPEGTFYGCLSNTMEAIAAKNLAAARDVENIVFIAGSPSQILTQSVTNKNVLPALDYFCCDSIATPLSGAEREALFALAAQQLKPSGLFSYRYRAYANVDDTLNFLVNEYLPEMNQAQSAEFLSEIKNLGALYFKERPLALAALNRAIDKNEPDEFYKTCHAGAASSGTFDVMAALLPLGFAYAADAEIKMNYMEMAAPSSSHAILDRCRNQLLFEPIKDFARQNLERCDIWCKIPAEQSDSIVDLYADFTYGITIPRAQVPTEIITQTSIIVLSDRLYANLIDLMCLMPIRIGDFMVHTSGKGFLPENIVAAVHLLIAGGIARPMRSSYHGKRDASSAHPRLTESFNAYLSDTIIASSSVMLASPTLGNGLAMNARDALVLQAIDRGGLSDSVDALMPELWRLMRDPAMASQIMDVTEPTPDLARRMIEDVVSQSMVRWYAYGLLAA